MVRLTRARYYTPSGRCVQKPYTPGDEEAYENDLIKRAEDGEYFNPDSIKTSGEKFHTRIGRTVYGGGGIIPDVFVSRDTTGYTTYFRQVAGTTLMNDFAYRFVDSHRRQMEKFTSHQEISTYLRTQDIVQAFVRYAETKGIKRRNLMIKTSHDLLFQFLTSYITADLLDTEDVVKYANLTDPAILRAMEIIREKRTFPQKDDTGKQFLRKEKPDHQNR